jgi:hypothetical protein
MAAIATSPEASPSRPGHHGVDVAVMMKMTNGMNRKVEAELHERHVQRRRVFSGHRTSTV